MTHEIRRTKIVCTLGPVSTRRETLAALMHAGMDVARLNTSHGTIEEHVRVVGMIREVAAEEGRTVAVLMDLGGPKIRTGATPAGMPMDLKGWETIVLTGDSQHPKPGELIVRYGGLTKDVMAGEQVLLDDGNVELVVLRVLPEGLECRVVHGGMIRPNKGVTFPHSNLQMPALTERDREAIAAGVKCGVDFFAQSFVGEARDVASAREAVEAAGGDIPIIAKIERRKAIANLEEILGEADGAMVARGDLGVEVAPEEVPVLQRRIIETASRKMIPVITATQMLESMVESARPTRAEASDVANAVWDLSDAVMLSAETAVGQYPVEAVAMMDRIIRRAEASDSSGTPPVAPPETDDHSYVVAVAARRIVESDANMRAVVCFTRSGYSASLLSKVHPATPIFAIAPSVEISRRLVLARSVVPLVGRVVDTTEEMLLLVDEALLAGGHVGEGEEVVVVGSMPVRLAGTTNFLKLHRVGEGSGR